MSLTFQIKSKYNLSVCTAKLKESRNFNILNTNTQNLIKMSASKKVNGYNSFDYSKNNSFHKTNDCACKQIIINIFSLSAKTRVCSVVSVFNFLRQKKYFVFQSNRKRKNSSNVSKSGKIQKTDTNQVPGNVVEKDDASDDGGHGAMDEDQDVEDVEEELKTSGSFNMKKFREKLKSGDFITGKKYIFAFVERRSIFLSLFCL